MSADPVLTLTASSKVDVCTVFPILPTKGLKLRAIRWRGEGHTTKMGRGSAGSRAKPCLTCALRETGVWRSLPQRWNLPFRARCYESQPLRHLLSLTLLRPLGLPWNLNLFQLWLSMEGGSPQAPWRGRHLVNRSQSSLKGAHSIYSWSAHNSALGPIAQNKNWTPCLACNAVHALALPIIPAPPHLSISKPLSPFQPHRPPVCSASVSHPRAFAYAVPPA